MHTKKQATKKETKETQDKRHHGGDIKETMARLKENMKENEKGKPKEEKQENNKTRNKKRGRKGKKKMQKQEIFTTKRDE